MAEQTETTTQENGANIVSRTAGVATKTVMIGLGAVGLASDGILKVLQNSGAFIGKLEERGEEMSQGGRDALSAQRDRVNSQMATREQQVKNLGSKANQSLNKAGETVLTAVNVPTSSEVQDLSKQINSLSRKVDRVRKEQQELLTAQEPAAA